MSKITESKLEYKDYDIFLTLEDKLNNLYKYKIVKDYKIINQLNGVTDYETAIKKAEKYIDKLDKRNKKDIKQKEMSIEIKKDLIKYDGYSEEEADKLVKSAVKNAEAGEIKFLPIKISPYTETEHFRNLTGKEILIGIKNNKINISTD